MGTAGAGRGVTRVAGCAVLRVRAYGVRGDGTCAAPGGSGAWTQEEFFTGDCSKVAYRSA